jgi:hypothetical protein
VIGGQTVPAQIINYDTGVFTYYPTWENGGDATLNRTQFLGCAIPGTTPDVKDCRLDLDASIPSGGLVLIAGLGLSDSFFTFFQLEIEGYGEDTLPAGIC